MSFSVAFSSRAWPRVAILALVAVAAAGCSDSARFGSNRSEYYQPPRSEVTGSISRRPAASSRVVSQPLPAPSKPKTVAAYYKRGTADGGRGYGAYRPTTRSRDVTGSVPAQAPQPAQPAGHWTWNGGTTVAIARGQTLASLGRTYQVPASAIMQVNHINNPRDIKTGQRIVIPRWVSGSRDRTAAVAAPHVQAPQTQAPRAQARAPRGDHTMHVAVRGDTLINIARHHGMTLSALAHYNHISPYTKLNVGDRVAIPAGDMRVASRETQWPALDAPGRAAARPTGAVGAERAGRDRARRPFGA